MFSPVGIRYLRPSCFHSSQLCRVMITKGRARSMPRLLRALY